MHDFQIAKAQPWADAVKFDIAAKSDQTPERSHEGASDDAILQARLQNLLADRFGLKVHRETAQRPVLEISLAGHGPKMQAGVTDTGYSTGSGQLKCSDSTMSVLASILSDYLDVIVIDRTGLTGGYKFSLSWKPQRAATDDDRPELPKALEEQLGLKLVRGKGVVDILIVDHVERPSDI